MTLAAKSRLGQSGRCYVIAEVGINHNGDLEIARKLIDMAADAGADAVKFQNFRTEDFLSNRSLTYTYISEGKEITESQWELFKRYELTGERLAAVAGHCRSKGVDFGSTATSAEGVDECLRLGATFLKNGSDHLNNLPLIRLMAKSGRPTILSTGMATVAETDDAVRAFRSAGGDELYLLHCVSLYPAPMQSLGLRRIPIMARAFGCPVGLSDHTEGVVAAVVAVALGAVVLERHITLDKKLAGPDHWFSADPSELRGLISSVRAAEASLGAEQLGFVPAESEARVLHRLSCVAVRNLSRNEVLKGSDIVFHRPGKGLPPASIDWLVGRRLTRDVGAGHPFSQDDFS